MHENIFDDYLVEKLIEDFRNYELVNESFIKELSKWKYSDKLRNHINHYFIEQIIDFIKTDKYPEIRLGHLLIRSLLLKEENILKPILLELYEKSNNPINKIGLIFDLLEYPDVAQEKSEEFFTFLENYRGNFETYEMEWYENEENLILAIESSLKLYIDTNKNWIYLYLLSLVKFLKDKATKIIDKYFININDEFINKIKKRVLQYLNSNKISLDEFYSESYGLAKKIINRHFGNSVNVLDIGCGNAPYLEEYFDNININFFLIDKEKYFFEKENTSFYQFDINQKDITEWASAINMRIDFIILNAAIHELWVGEKLKYFQNLFDKIIDLIQIGGKIYIGDYYYSKTVTPTQFKEYSKSLRENVGHADPIERFYYPSELFSMILMKKNIKIIEFCEVRMSKVVDRFFYGFLLEKEN